MKGAVLLAAILGLAGCEGAAHQDIHTSLAITNAVKIRLAGGGGVVRAGEVLPGDWDRVEVAAPYTPVEAIETKTGPDPRIGSSGIEARDDITLLILIKSGTILSVVQFPRSTADFSPMAGPPLKPDDCLNVVSGEPPRVERGSGC